MELAWATEWGLTIYRNLLDVPMAGVADAKNPSNGRLSPADVVTETEVALTRLSHACDDLPAYQTADAAALDLCAAIPGGERYVIKPFHVEMIPTGIQIAIPPGCAGLILARSGLASRTGVVPANAPGLIDPDFRGEVTLAMYNRSSVPFTVVRGDRLAQFLLVPYLRVVWREAATLDTTERGSAGWGSTGRR